jgi:hypothetical protein
MNVLVICNLNYKEKTMAQLEKAPVKLEELVKNGVIKVSPNYVTIPATNEKPEHILFKATGDGQANFIVYTHDVNIPPKTTFNKVKKAGTVEVELINPVFDTYIYPENGEDKVQLALCAKHIKIKGDK